MSKKRAIIAAISFLMLCGETQIKGWTGTVIQILWSGFWMAAFIKAVGGLKVLWTIMKN